MKIIQKLSAEEYRQAYQANFKTSPLSRLRPVIAVCLSAIGVAYLIKADNTLLGILFLLYAAYMLVREKIVVSKKVKQAQSSSYYNQDTEYTLEQDDFTVKTNNKESTLRYDELHGFQVYKQGLLLYLKANAFLILNRSAFPQAKDYDAFLQKLKSLELRRMG